MTTKDNVPDDGEFRITQRRSRSFRRFCHAVEELVECVESGEAAVTPGAPEENTIGGKGHD